MPKDPKVTSKPPLAVAGVATVLAPATAPSLPTGGATGMAVQCDSCTLNLPRSATHQDVLSHPCYRGFSISLNAAGHLVLA